jgi:hypothetical protein
MLKLSVKDVKEGIEQYYGKEWLFKVLNGATWELGYKSARIVVDGIEINVFETTDVIRMGLWYSTYRTRGYVYRTHGSRQYRD